VIHTLILFIRQRHEVFAGLDCYRVQVDQEYGLVRDYRKGEWKVEGACPPYTVTLSTGEVFQAQAVGYRL
jgi:hypothetical protein